MFIKQPQLTGVHTMVSGKVKFFKREENFGFIETTIDEQQIDVFVHRQWIMKPIMYRQGHVFGIKMIEASEALHPEQLVFMDLKENKERGCFEARNVVDMLELQMCIKSTAQEIGKYIEWMKQLPIFRVHVVKDVIKYAANNKTKKYDPVKIGEEKEQIFFGNDTNELEKVISGYYLLKHMHILIEKKEVDQHGNTIWIPVSRVAA